MQASKRVPSPGDWSTRMALGLRPVTHGKERENTATTSRATFRPKDLRRRASAGGCLQENSKIEAAAAVEEMLGDESAVLEATQKTDINSSQVDRVLHAARTWRHRLQSEAEQTSAIGALVDRVELKSDGIRVSIKLPIASAEKSRAQLPDQVAIARSFPMQLKRRGVELRLIIGDHNRSAAIVDLALLKAVARAHRWFDEIGAGKASSLAAIAAREGLAVRYVGRLIRLAFLAPEIVESIMEGRQPTTLTAEALTRRIELPLSWCSQRTALNVE